MRLKADNPDDGLITRSVEVTLDGENVTRLCSEADDKEGWVILYQLDPAKNKKPSKFISVLVGPDKNPVSETKYGKVEFTLKPDASEGARLEFERRKASEQ